MVGPSLCFQMLIFFVFGIVLVSSLCSKGEEHEKDEVTAK